MSIRAVVLFALVAAQASSGLVGQAPPPADVLLVCEGAVYRVASKFGVEVPKNGFTMRRDSTGAAGAKQWFLELAFDRPFVVPLELVAALASEVETGAPAWRLAACEVRWDAEAAGLQAKGRLMAMTFAKNAPTLPGAAALAQLRTVLDALATQHGADLARPATLQLHSTDDRKASGLDFAFDTTGEKYRSKSALVTAAFDAAVESKDGVASVFARVRAEPRETAHADGKGAQFALSIELRAPKPAEPSPTPVPKPGTGR